MNEELEMMNKVYDYTQYSHDNHVNVIPEKDFKRLVSDTFKTITDTLRETYGPYGSSVIISDQGETTTTKDGYNVFSAMGFSHAYKRMVYLAINKIITRVNRNVGDGTTSCVLLAEKLFNILKAEIQDTEHKRTILETLSIFESAMQDEVYLKRDREEERIKPLSISRVHDIIKMAANGDETLTNALLEAFEIEEKEGYITNIRNVITNVVIDPSVGSNVSYKTDYLPGDYRVRINMSDDQAMYLSGHPTKAKVAIYDHTFNAAEWSGLFNGWKPSDFEMLDDTVIIIARSFNRNFMENEYKRYLMHHAVIGKTPRVILAEIKGEFLQDEIHDLGAVLHTDVHTINEEISTTVSSLPEYEVQVFNKNALCFFNVGEVDPTYLQTIRFARDNDKSNSLVKSTYYADRLKALSMKSKDTIITVTAGNSLEAKLVSDKIDDCVSIVQSSLNFGTVPNMLRYAHYRASDIYDYTTNDDLKLVASAIRVSIEGLFDDIWDSKHGSDFEGNRTVTKLEMYHDNWNSYNIITETFCKDDELNTSTQYDIEVVVSAISIVKYLLTSRALVFDAHILPQVNDVGRYEQNY